jgi:ATP-binding cassette subfamily B protein
MLLRLLRSHLRPYRTWLGLSVTLQFVGTIAALYLPALNAGIIDNGVVKRPAG